MAEVPQKFLDLWKPVDPYFRREHVSQFDSDISDVVRMKPNLSPIIYFEKEDKTKQTKQVFLGSVASIEYIIGGEEPVYGSVCLNMYFEPRGLYTLRRSEFGNTIDARIRARDHFDIFKSDPGVKYSNPTTDHEKIRENFEARNIDIIHITGMDRDVLVGPLTNMICIYNKDIRAKNLRLAETNDPLALVLYENEEGLNKRIQDALSG